MRLEEYLEKQVGRFVEEISKQAPVDCCPDCDVCEGHLAYNGTKFYYECSLCGKQWSAECLEVEGEGKFLMLEFGD